MARRPIITRTVEGTQVDVLGLNIKTAEPENKTYVLSGKYADDKKLLKAVQSGYDTDEFKNIAIVGKKPVSKLYGMWEENFIASAFELDPQTRKPLASAETEEPVEAE